MGAERAANENVSMFHNPGTVLKKRRRFGLQLVRLSKLRQYLVGYKFCSERGVILGLNAEELGHLR